MTARLADALAACADPAVPQNVALMRLLVEADNPAGARDALVEAERDARTAGLSARATRLAAISALLAAHPGSWATVRAVVEAADHGRGAEAEDVTVGHWARVFDTLAESQPEAGIALYALGSPELLAAATTEVVRYLETSNLLAPDRVVLDIGCGSGRFVEALASRVAHVTGLDVSAGMIGRARSRCAGLANVTLAVSTGTDLAPVEHETVDLVLAADVVPYLVAAGDECAARHVAEAARVLRPGGVMLALNWSYRGDDGRDRADVARYAEAAGLRVADAGSRPFTLWDAAVFRLVKPPKPVLSEAPAPVAPP